MRTPRRRASRLRFLPEIPRLPIALAAAALALASLVATPRPSLAQEAVQAIATPGLAELQVCRSWIVMRTCNAYHRVDVPPRIAVGDQLSLIFGSNNKTMIFEVAAIRRGGDACTLYTETPAPGIDENHVDKLTVAPCNQPS